MQEIFADFMRLQDLPDGTRRIRINAQRVEDANLKDGDKLMVVEDGQLQAPAILRCIAENGSEHWYAVLTGPIEDLLEVG